MPEANAFGPPPSWITTVSPAGGKPQWGPSLEDLPPLFAFAGPHFPDAGREEWQKDLEGRVKALEDRAHPGPLRVQTYTEAEMLRVIERLNTNGDR